MGSQFGASLANFKALLCLHGLQMQRCLFMGAGLHFLALAHCRMRSRVAWTSPGRSPLMFTQVSPYLQRSLRGSRRSHPKRHRLPPN